MTLKDITKITKDFNVLFVEDDTMVQEVTISVLKSFFPNIDLALNGQEGLDKFNQNNYDLIITDLAMPKLHGTDMIKQIKQVNPNIYIIVLSAIDDHDYVIDTMKLGIDGYLFKPLMFDKFLDILETIVQRENVNGKLSLYNQSIEEQVEKRTQHIQEKVNVDNLTQLGTLASLISKLDNSDNFKSPVIILINIDAFNVFNQLYGIEIGNEILLKLTDILKNYNKDKSYEIFRINADEFVLLDLVEYLDIDKYEKDISELFSTVENNKLKIKNVEEPIEIEITAGISFSSSQSLKKANMALFEARRRGRKFIGFTYDLDYTEELESNLFWRQEIKHAIKDDRVVAFYQPIVNRDQNIIQYESFIRIKRENKKGEIEYFAPSEFLDLSIMTKQYLLLTKFMIETTLKKMKNDNISISINLTYQDIKNEDIYNILRNTIKEHHLEHQTEFDISNNVIFEILENEGVDCYKTFLEFIKEFKDMGVKIALDDFGTGFSNFSHITTLCPDYIKIDGALIESVHTDKKSYELVNAIVKFSKELNIKTIAEHVQSKEIFDLLHKMGIDKFQGYYFGIPKENI